MNISLKEIFDDANELDKKSLDFLLKAIAKNNQTGFDYLEFKQALIRLNKMGVDEDTAIKSAFATASTVGLTKEKLLESAGYYLNILKDEFKQFNTALEKQMESKVHSREKQKSSLESKITALDKKIKNLTEERKDLESKLSSIDQQADVARKKIKETSDRFEKTLKAITVRIEGDVDQFDSELP
ncbi:hypothetical protein KUV50_03250 [Membranicola marinus]|uniref:Uncharacterized protein n=1 Tax=Membranihabitans marinus TaxID=1227546 RepID=A0A953HSK3_9BACT|nr:hypothetical protein [Membranihabitans marinus]MBY5957138.1 hypothetical protein [Membranihabitans marinus]